MGYLMINGDENERHYNVILDPFSTQHGYPSVKIIGEAVPSEDIEANGFKFYGDDDHVIGDYTEYTHRYGDPEGAIPAYSNKADTPFDGDGGEAVPMGPSVFDRINARINGLQTEVNDMTPYSETKTAYINDTQLIFDRPRDGAVSVYMIDANGLLVNTKEIVEPHRVIVQFEKREITATVTMTIA